MDNAADKPVTFTLSKASYLVEDRAPFFLYEVVESKVFGKRMVARMKRTSEGWQITMTRIPIFRLFYYLQLWYYMATNWALKIQSSKGIVHE
jgi:hypothetical protein